APRRARAPWDEPEVRAWEDDEDLDWDAPVSPAIPDLDAEGAIKSIEQDFAVNLNASDAERKRIFRKYLMRWHPDKNPEESKATATFVVQYLYTNKAWFLGSSTEITPLLQNASAGMS
ncbi:unnamed protein product, partial [Effrenium voratum]